MSVSVRVRVRVRVSESGFVLVVWGKREGCGGEWREVKNGGWVGRRVGVGDWGWIR